MPHCLRCGVFPHLPDALLVVCGSHVDEAVKNDIAVAQRLGITATTLDGILTVKGQRRR